MKFTRIEKGLKVSDGAVGQEYNEKLSQEAVEFIDP